MLRRNLCGQLLEVTILMDVTEPDTLQVLPVWQLYLEVVSPTNTLEDFDRAEVFTINGFKYN